MEASHSQFCTYHLPCNKFKCFLDNFSCKVNSESCIFFFYPDVWCSALRRGVVRVNESQVDNFQKKNYRLSIDTQDNGRL